MWVFLDWLGKIVMCTCYVASSFPLSFPLRGRWGVVDRVNSWWIKVPGLVGNGIAWLTKVRETSPLGQFKSLCPWQERTIIRIRKCLDNGSFLRCRHHFCPILPSRTIKTPSARLSGPVYGVFCSMMAGIPFCYCSLMVSAKNSKQPVPNVGRAVNMDYANPIRQDWQR